MAETGSAHAPTVAASATAAERRARLKQLYLKAQGCVRCPELASTRQNVVFGAGNADANLMFVGEAPGSNEDRLGLPFVGQAGKLLDRLLGEIGLERADVFIANVLKCRPPGNRDPLPEEIAKCRGYLFEQVELIEPRVICSLGNFSTKLLRNDTAGITQVHGRPELITIGRRVVRLYPIYHPAAALYTPRMLEVLREDFTRLPELLELPPPPQRAASAGSGGPAAGPEREAAKGAAGAPVVAPRADQLGLF